MLILDILFVKSKYIDASFIRILQRAVQSYGFGKRPYRIEDLIESK